MPFIGNQPSAVPLTSADITDGIIVNADISSTAGITLNKISGNPNFRNIVINGDMQIAQRSTSVASVTTGGYKALDRFYIENTTMGTWTISQSTDVPTGEGFAYSLKYDCTTADASPASTDEIGLRVKLEGQNLQYLKFGTANAQSLTLSFWIKSNKTGTYNVALFGQHSAPTAQYLTKAYTISTANTWEKKTITYVGNTSNGFTNDNTRGLDINWNFGTGSSQTGGTLQTGWSNYGTSADYFATQSVNLADNTANELFITGIQLEAGTSATDFEFLPYDVDLLRCYRYYYQTVSSESIGVSFSATQASFKAKLPVTMRTTPALTMPTSGSFRGDLSNGNKASATAPVSANPTPSDVYWYSTGYSGASVGELIYWTGDPIKISAEL